MKAFLTPRTSLGDLDAESAATLVAAAADIALVIDSHGIIRDLACHDDELTIALDDSPGWIGRPLSATVVADSVSKVQALLRDVRSDEDPKWRHLNHIGKHGSSIPVTYCAVRFSDDGRVVIFGRDLRDLSTLQQKLVNAQQSLERDYSRLRDFEMRYRLLFQLSAEAVLVIDTAKQRVVEANPAAQALLGVRPDQIVGQTLTEVFDARSVTAVQTHLAIVRAGADSEVVAARLLAGQAEVTVSARLFRQDNSTLYLVRIVPVGAGQPAAGVPDIKAKLVKVVENAPDGFVVTGLDGRIITANAAFLEFAQLNSEEQARGEQLDRWLGQSEVDLNVLIANLRERGVVRFFSTTLRGEYGATAEVEVSAVFVPNGAQACFGFAIRNVGARIRTSMGAGRDIPRSIEQFTELIGRVSLKDLVREATDVIERLCIEAALELTGDNRASAAELLGLSRQSLYVKLRRYGLGDLAADTRN